jgi:hypothetical protein
MRLLLLPQDSRPELLPQRVWWSVSSSYVHCFTDKLDLVFTSELGHLFTLRIHICKLLLEPDYFCSPVYDNLDVTQIWEAITISRHLSENALLNGPPENFYLDLYLTN